MIINTETIKKFYIGKVKGMIRQIFMVKFNKRMISPFKQ